MKKKRVYLLEPTLMDSQITKDVGMIPYILQRYYNYETTFAVYKPKNKEINLPSLHLFDESINIDPIDPSFDYQIENRIETAYGKNNIDFEQDMIRYVKNKANQIDILFIFGFYKHLYNVVKEYKKLNPDGIVYLKLDANINWVNNTEMTDEFSEFLKNCDLVTCEAFIDYINLKWPVPVYYIPNGFYFSNSYRMEKLVSYEEKENIIITVGRNGIREKATDVLLQSFLKAHLDMNEKWKLVIIGGIEPAFNEYIVNFFTDYPFLQEFIYFTGPILDKDVLNSWYKKAKIFALPSIVEASCHALSEAKAHGCYLLVSDVSSNREAVVTNDKRGRLQLLKSEYKTENIIEAYGSVHQIGDIVGFAKSIKFACESSELLKEVCYSTQKDALQNYDWIKIVRKIKILLDMQMKN